MSEINNFYQKIDDILSESFEIDKFDQYTANINNISVVNNVNQSIKIILACRILKKLNKNIVFVTKDDKIAEEITEDFNVMLNESLVNFIPDYETLPYEERSPHYMLRAQRLRAFMNIFFKSNSVYCTSYRNLIRKIINPDVLKSYIRKLSIAQEYDLSELLSYLSNCGFEHSSQIEKVGQFSKRGGIVDVFSPNYTLPVRIEFFGDEVISLRHFSVSTQRSEINELKEVIIIPTREVIFNDDIKKSKLRDKIEQSGFYEGIESDITLIYPETFTMFDYFDNDNTVYIFDNFNLDFDFISLYKEEIFESYTKSKKNNKKRLIPEPDDLILRKEEFESKINNHTVHFMNNAVMHQKENQSKLFNKNQCEFQFSVELSPFFNSDLQILENTLKFLQKESYQIFIQLENQAQKNRMKQLLDDYDINVSLCLGVLHKGFIFKDLKLAVFTDHEIFKRIKHKKMDLAFSKGEALVDYESLKIGDYIVHIEHGIGVYEGLKTLQVGDKKIECLCIHYAGTDKIYVPTWQLKLVSKYVSEEGSVPVINKLGTKTWEAIKQRAKKQIELVVDDIVKLYAERKIHKGITFKEDSEWQEEMEQSFIYEDTPDQRTATDEIKRDMEQDVPMERLLCGDVGFGKTEVAIRAAFKAVLSGYQVAVLVPTTLLAEQHFLVFKERLAQFPVKIAMLSRFRTAANIDKDLVKLRNGQIDIIIGTHRVLSKDVVFKKIGLLIIDEEHRFGVKHKEKIRQIKANVDTLYMSATPIPRTMNMVLSKLKSMSLIQTSPKARLPIRTAIVPYDHDIIKDAILRETDRGGQVYFIHNRVETIESIYLELKTLLPNIRFTIGHGQLPERKLEKVLTDFAEHNFDVLIATTIIESGIDIPNANTILINRADMFGLAQLYQIRGRVGRSNRRAYAYLMIPKKLSDIGRKRLETLTEYESLGAGYQIAMRDLEIRGAGTLLGTKQSGVITSVGFNFYNKLLDQAVKNLLEENPKGLWDEEDKDSDDLRSIEINSDFYFPQNYITDEKQKLQIYKRMIDFNDVSQFNDLNNELIDRYGPIPDLAKNVITYFKIRFLSKVNNLKSFLILKEKMIIEFDKENLPPKSLIGKIIGLSENQVSFDTTNGLRISFIFNNDYKNDKNKKLDFALTVINLLNNTKNPTK